MHGFSAIHSSSCSTCEWYEEEEEGDYLQEEGETEEEWHSGSGASEVEGRGDSEEERSSGGEQGTGYRDDNEARESDGGWQYEEDLEEELETSSSCGDSLQDATNLAIEGSETSDAMEDSSVPTPVPSPSASSEVRSEKRLCTCCPVTLQLVAASDIRTLQFCNIPLVGNICRDCPSTQPPL